jgi:thiol-disulfide isomerase/thioredoxin
MAGHRLATHLGLPLSAGAAVVEASAENFADLVLGNSEKGLVLAYYWSPQAGPCMRLMPRLVDLARAYAGRFLLVLVNTDNQGTLARGQGVNSVPTVKFYLRGAVVHSIHGAESDAVFRAALARYISLEEDRARAGRPGARTPAATPRRPSPSWRAPPWSGPRTWMSAPTWPSCSCSPGRPSAPWRCWPACLARRAATRASPLCWRTCN